MRVLSAFVLGAGLGTRLRPLTDVVPKPLVPVFHKPLITFALDHLMSFGVESFVINTHHQAAQFEQAFAEREYRGRKVSLVYEPLLLETGGGIKNAQSRIGNQPFIVYSGDILTDIDLGRLLEEHFHRGNDVTLALRETGLATGIALTNGRVIDIRNRYGHAGNCDFANISIWNPAVFNRIPSERKISFVPVLSDWIGQGGKIGGVLINENHWFNIGSQKEYFDVHRIISEGGWRPDYVTDTGWPVPISPGARIDHGVTLEGMVSIGSGVIVGEGAFIRDSILWPGAVIAPGARIEDSIVSGSEPIAGTHQGAVL